MSFFTNASLDGLLEALRSIGGIAYKTDILTLSDADICCPNAIQAPLIHRLSLKVQEGNHLFITGPNGTGKSTLLRALYAHRFTRDDHIQWDVEFSSESNVLAVMHLPQCPLLAPGSHLWQQLAYPSNIRPPDSAILSALNDSGLSDLVQKVAMGLDSVEDWSTFLSFGQQQRLAFSRIFLHRPRVVLLDEATSGIDEQEARKLIRKVQSLGHMYPTTCITVSQDAPGMRDLHSLHLTLYPRHPGSTTTLTWSLQEISTHN